MILTPLPLTEIPATMAAFAKALDRQELAVRVLARIEATLSAVDGPDISLSQKPEHRAQAIALLQSHGLGIRDLDPAGDVTWDGSAVAARMEPSVIIHELAHYQLAGAQRRSLVDFGLGAGPESGDKARGEADRIMVGVDCDREEAQASLLGVLWEAELGQPAILAFLEQNWLEGGASRHNLDHFVKVCGQLHQSGLIDHNGRPQWVPSGDQQPGQDRHQERGDDAIEPHRQP